MWLVVVFTHPEKPLREKPFPFVVKTKREEERRNFLTLLFRAVATLISEGLRNRSSTYFDVKSPGLEN